MALLSAVRQLQALLTGYGTTRRPEDSNSPPCPAEGLSLTETAEVDARGGRAGGRGAGQAQPGAPAVGSWVPSQVSRGVTTGGFLALSTTFVPASLCLHRHLPNHKAPFPLRSTKSTSTTRVSRQHEGQRRVLPSVHLTEPCTCPRRARRSASSRVCVLASFRRRRMILLVQKR